MRYAFTIIFNGKHHLLNQRFIDLMVGSFDKWIIVEGFSSNGGSTGWCNNINIQRNSTDGTLELLAELVEKHSNIIVHSRKNGWKSKDEQVNKAIELFESLLADPKEDDRALTKMIDGILKQRDDVKIIILFDNIFNY